MKEEQKAVEALKKIKTILDRNNINYWLDEGTLLGAVREKKLIEWDHDIDLSIWYTDLEKIKPLFNEIEKTGVQVCFFEWKKHIKILGDGYEIDINLYHIKDEKATRMWHAHNKFGRIIDYIIWTQYLKNAKKKEFKVPLFITKFLIKSSNITPKLINKIVLQSLVKLYAKLGCKVIEMAVPLHFFTNLSDLEFYNMTFKVPKKTEDYLECRYGKGWRVPKKDYVFHKDDCSIVKN